MSPPSGVSGAPSVKNGPTTVDSVAPADAGALIPMVSMDRPSTSDSRMNSCRRSSVRWPARVRKSMPNCHSSWLSRMSRANACSWRTRLCATSRYRGDAAPAKLASTSAVTAASRAACTAASSAAAGQAWPTRRAAACAVRPPRRAPGCPRAPPARSARPPRRAGPRAARGRAARRAGPAPARACTAAAGPALSSPAPSSPARSRARLIRAAASGAPGRLNAIT